MKIDDKNNCVEVCLFESYLAKYFLEHPEIFQTLISKIFAEIDSFVELNENHPYVDRILFTIFTQVRDTHPEIVDFQTLKASDSLVAYDTFFKYFTEMVMEIPGLKFPEPTVSPNALSDLCYASLFKSRSIGMDIIKNKMRPKWLYSDSNRGITEVDEYKLNAASPVFDLGILSPDDTPVELKNYFKNPHAPSRQIYKPNESSEMATWLRSHSLPVISGASGGIGITLSRLSAIIKFSREEYLLLGILTASSTVALGHHSFFEILRPLSFLTGDIIETQTLLDFYEQMIPKSIKDLSSYQEHIKSDCGLVLLDEMDKENHNLTNDTIS